MEAVGEGKGLYQRICLPTWPVILCIFSLFQMHIIQAGHVEDLEHAGKKNRLVPVMENFVLCTFIFHALHQRLKKSALLVQMPYNRKHEFYFVYCFPVPDWVPKAIFGGIIAFFVVMSHLSMEASITLGQDMSSDRSRFSLFRFLLLKFGTQSL